MGIVRVIVWCGDCEGSGGGMVWHCEGSGMVWGL